MDTIGLELRKRGSQLCLLGDDGTVTERRIVASLERVTVVLGERPAPLANAHFSAKISPMSLAAVLFLYCRLSAFAIRAD